MSELISTSIHIRQKPSRRKSVDETTRHLNDNTRQKSHSSATNVYYLQHKRASRSLGDLNDSLFTDEDVMIEVNGNSSFNGSFTVKSAAVITLNKENSIQTFLSTTQSINDSNNNTFTDTNDEVFIKRHDEATGSRDQRRRLRNKSTGDVIDMKKKQIERLEEENDVSASVDNIYENGLYTKLVESDSETPTKSRSTNLRPKKPQRSKKSLQHLLNRSVPLNVGDEEVSRYYRELNASLDEHNNLSISKEDFDAFVSREQTKYSGYVSQPSFVSEDDSLSEISRSRVQSWGSDSMNISNVSQRSTDFIDSKHRSEMKMKQLGDVLSDQLNSLEDLLATRPPPRRSSAQNSRRSRSVENICEKKRLSMIEESNSRQNSKRNVNGLSHNLLEKNKSVKKINEAYITKALPDIPREPTIKDRLKSIKRSLSTSRKRIIKKSGENIEFPALRKSIRLPKKSFRSRKRSLSLKDISKNRDSNERDVLSDDQNIILRNNEARSRKLYHDYRSSRIIGIECDVMNGELTRERKKIEDEKNRLSELRRIAAERAELEWNEKKRDIERRETEEKEIESKREMLEQLKKEQEEQAERERKVIAEQTEKMRLQEELLKQREHELEELRKERERREELEQLLLQEKQQENVLERSLHAEKEKFNTLERSLAEERNKRLETERRLQEEENKNRTLEHKKPLADTRSSNGATSVNGTLKRRVPSYTLSIRSGQSGNSEEVNLLHHILAAGHVIDNCPVVKINRYSCRGYLLKMGKSRLKVTWNKRWFVFDRKLRALLYYQDERKTKSKGILYFQSIQEVYVDSSIKKSPNPKTTFCVRTPQRTFVLSAATPIAMSIWIDVICTGKEGAFTSMTL